jgi:hypothetical protein
MAHVLNRPERNQAFWKFLFFFLLSTALIVGAVYYDTDIPTKENEKLRKQVSRYTTQAKEQQKFVKGMEDVNGLFDSLMKKDASPESRTYITRDITDRIKDLSDLQDRDSSMYSGLKRNIASVYLKYLTATNANMSMAELRAKLQESEKNYQQAKTDKDNAEQKLALCQQGAAAARNPGY